MEVSSMLKAPLRVVLVGSGKISEEHLKCLSKDRRVRVVGVCDLSPSLARYSATKFAAEASFVDYRDMFERTQPDVVHVLTPPHTHVPIITDALIRGINVIAEKPLAPTARELQKLWEMSQQAGLLLIENHNYRFNTPILEIERSVREGVIGKVVEAEVRFCLGIRGKGGRYSDEGLPHPSHRLPAGVIHEFLPHMVYLLLRFIPRWNSVDALWNNHGGGELFSVDDLDARIMNGNQHGRLRFSCEQFPDCFTVTVRGDKGWVEADLFQPCVTRVIPRRVGQQLTPLYNQFAKGVSAMGASLRGFFNKVVQVTPYEGLDTFLHHCYSALTVGDPPPVSFGDMNQTAMLIDQLVCSKDKSGTISQ